MSASDAEPLWAPGPDVLERVLGEVGGLGPRLHHIEADLADPADRGR